MVDKVLRILKFMRKVKSLPKLEDVALIHPLVTRILGKNPGFATLQGTNSFLVGQPGTPRLLIDTTSTGDCLNRYLEVLERELRSSSAILLSSFSPISAILLTHWHPDHSGGITAVQNLVRRLAPSSPAIPVYKFPAGPRLDEIGYYQGPLEAVEDVYVLPHARHQPPSAILKPIYTPGHSIDHLSFTLSVGNRVECIFVGDVILGYGTTLVNDLCAYLSSLKTIREVVVRANNPDLFLIPSHGDVIRDPLKVIDQYLSHRENRISQTKKALTSFPSNAWIQENQLLEKIYPNIIYTLRLPAINNLRQSLFWLQNQKAEDTGFCIPEPTIKGQSHIVRDASLYLCASAVVRPGHIPPIFAENWQWMWRKTC